jgi:hypothetical protein
MPVERLVQAPPGRSVGAANRKSANAFRLTMETPIASFRYALVALALAFGGGPTTVVGLLVVSAQVTWR